MAFRILPFQTGKEGSGPQYISNGRKLDDENPLAYRAIFGTALTGYFKLAGPIAQKITAIEPPRRLFYGWLLIFAWPRALGTRGVSPSYFFLSGT
jgi:hypothetical protein